MYKEKPFQVEQGEIYYANIGEESTGSVQKGTRPVIITQNDRLNANSTTYVCALITSQIKRLDLPEHVLLPMMKGLPKQSMVMAEQRKTVANSELIKYCCKVDKDTFVLVERALKASEINIRHKRRKNLKLSVFKKRKLYKY